MSNSLALLQNGLQHAGVWLAAATAVAATATLSPQSHLWRPRLKNETDGRMIAAQANLEYCPVDILLEVVRYLDVKDILRLRGVSQKMAAFTRSRPVWDHLMTVSGAAVLLRKRRSLCSSKELEDVVVQQATSEAKLRKGGKWICDRTHTLEDSWARDFLPGGRWLLDTTKDFHSGVRYADLDSAEPQWQQLIPPLSDPISFCFSCVDHVSDAPALTVHLALALRREIRPRKICPDGRISPPFTIDEISIWQISSAYNDSGAITGLNSERISRFSHRLPRDRCLRFMKLQGPHLICVLTEPFWTCSVIRWAEVNGCDDNFPRKVIRFPHCNMGQLLTEDVLLVGTEKGQILTLWDLSAVSLSQSYAGPPVCTAPKWKSQPLASRVHMVHPSWPPPRIVDNVAFQVIPQHKGMLLLTVPFPLGRDTPTLSSCESASVKLIHAPPCFTLSWGETAYIPFYTADGPPPIFQLHYRDDVNNPAVFSLPLQKLGLKPYLDAYSPRLVLLERGTSFHICSITE